MKKISSVIFVAAIVCVFAACSGRSDNLENEGDSIPPDFKTRVDTSGIKTTTMSDTAFASAVAASSMGEVALGKLALAKSSNKKIKLLATMMLKDHSHSSNELQAIAKTKTFKLPTALNAQYQAKKDSLKQLSGIMFDQAFVNSTIEGHQRILVLLKSEVAHGKDADLKDFAAKTATSVQTRLDEIGALYQSMK
jgi:putative membrane protein